MEREFFSSLDHLAGMYGFKAERFTQIVYPYNLHLSFTHAKKCMERANNKVELQVVQDEEHTAVIATFNTLSIGQQLYYIPLKPLWDLLKQRKNKIRAQLLLSLFANLYRRGVASYRDGDSFLSGNYEMLAEWIMENPGEWEEADYLQSVSDLNKQSCYGDKLFRQIKHPLTAKGLPALIQKYQPQTEWEQEFAAVARQFNLLLQQYPDATFFDHMQPELTDSEDNTVMYPDYYLSFYWTDNDSIQESLMENINSTLNECSKIIEPMTIQLFDKPQQQQREDCYFEWRFLLLTDYLCDLLFNML